MIMNIIDKIYSNGHFTTILIGAIAFLVVLFIIVLYLGIKDAKKAKEPAPKEKEEKDITFEEIPQEQKEIAEDVTFEMGTITKNLEDFKKGLEEELQNAPTEDIEPIKEEVPVEEPKEKEEPVQSEEEVEDSFLDLIDRKKKEEEPATVEAPEEKKEKEAQKPEKEELELPKMNGDNKKDDLNSEARKKKEKMIDEYLSATKALSLDDINKKIEEMEKDDF